MSINRAFFFEVIRESLFPNGLKQSQVDGAEAILDAWESDHAAKDDRWLAYILATAYHESAHTLQAVRETLANTDDQAIKRLETAWNAGKLPWVKTPYWRRDADGKSWYGRGLVQLTHKRNYEALGTRLGVDLVTDPDAALDLDIAVKIIIAGMIEGLFTKRKLKDFFDGDSDDWAGARRIINGLESADRLAGHGRAFYRAISYK
ncbi:putative chitinase [Rhizobium sp. SG_E_25_P2]|uniref:glycoside hydrolase family 19 protein n=1 Tax=Rhizobium sp. SG_E_25_P2 TaxID=2879942 RepID=UPI0024734D00|nr:glycoside hydrolase family 19 protein [Rhizobium sp. SG_E_25_P2]MDH6268406.1 putative chitinase [Rhizobium sp. SG_E_25_P2]